jgi:hypothetical protein
MRTRFQGKYRKFHFVQPFVLVSFHGPIIINHFHSMSLQANRYYVGYVDSFIQIMKLVRSDPEFRIRFDFQNHSMDIECLLMSGIVGIGIHLVKGVGSILVPSPVTREDVVTIRVNSNSFLSVFVKLMSLSYAYLSIWTKENELCIEIYDGDHKVLGSGCVNTLTLEDGDDDFMIIEEESREKLEYPIQESRPGSLWKTYFHAGTDEDTIIRCDVNQSCLTWTTRTTLTKICLNMNLVTSSSTVPVLVCILPSVVQQLKQIITVTAKQETTLSLCTELPIRMFTVLDTNGSFIRVYAGTKEDEM